MPGTPCDKCRDDRSPLFSAQKALKISIKLSSGIEASAGGRHHRVPSALVRVQFTHTAQVHDDGAVNAREMRARKPRLQRGDALARAQYLAILLMDRVQGSRIETLPLHDTNQASKSPSQPMQIV